MTALPPFTPFLCDSKILGFALFALDSRLIHICCYVSRPAGARLILAFDLGQLIMQARSFSAILCRLNTVLHSRDAAHRIHHLRECVALALAKMLKLVGVIVLALGPSLGFVNTSLKIPDLSPALSLLNHRIADRLSGVLQLSTIVLQVIGESLEIILPVRISQVGGQTVPGQSPRVIHLHALSELIHPAELIFRHAVAL